MPINIRHIEAFRMLMTMGTVSQAAKLLGISQPALSQMIQALERDTEITLFERQRGRLIPTRAAKVFFEESERVFVGLDALTRKAASLRDAHGDGRERLTVGCLHALGSGFVLDVIKQFRVSHSTTLISLQLQSSRQIREAVISGQLDFGIVADEAEPLKTVGSLFSETPAILALPAKHRLAKQNAISAHDLDNEPFIALNPEDRMRQRFESAMLGKGLTLNIVVETPYSATACGLVQRGIGVSLVNPLTALSYVNQGVVFRRFTPVIPFRTLLIFPPNSPSSPATKKFIAELRKALANALLKLQSL
jgi:DNA-binding transcriptional LysR family regulator